MKLRIRLIQYLISINEKMFFYPALRNYYKGKLNDNSIILDVGSNKGQSIDFFKGICKRLSVYGFEPNKKLFERLKTKYRAHSTSIRLFNYGISNQEGTLIFKETITDETSTFEELNFNSEYLKYKARVLGVAARSIIEKEYPVEVKRLSQFLTDQDISKVDVLKIDTEGHELKCLEGLFPLNQVDINIIQLEYHKDDMYVERVTGDGIEAFLKQYGFRIDKKLRHGFGDFEEWLFIKDSSIVLSDQSNNLSI